VSTDERTNDTELAAWETANSYLIPFVTHVDALYPSLYTFYSDPAKWVALAQRYISEAKRIGPGKPVGPFIWPQCQDVIHGPLAGTYIDYDYWMLQLTTIRDAEGDGNAPPFTVIFLCALLLPYLPVARAMGSSLASSQGFSFF